MEEKNELTVVEQPQQLITIEPVEYVAQVFEPFAKRLADAKTLAAAAEFDVTTTAGMAVAVKHRATFREIRVASEKARKERKAPILEIGKLLDSRQKEIEAEIEPFESRFDSAIKAEEKRKDDEKIAKALAESARITAIRKRIAEMQSIPAMLVGKQSVTIATAIEGLEAAEITLESFAEFAGEAEMAKIATVAKLGEMLMAQQAHEAEAARLAEERAELEARRRAQAERDRQAAEARELDERLAREAREREAARVKAEQDKAAAELRAQQEAHAKQVREHQAEMARQQAEIDAERQRQADEAARVEREKQAAIAAEAARVEAEAQAKRDAEETAARQEAERVINERLAADAEELRRKLEQFAMNGPGDVEIVKTLATHYRVTIGDAMQWMKKFDYAAADEYFAAANVAGNLLEKAA